MWLRLAWPHLNLPEAVLRKRFAAPRWVLILGIADVLSGSCNWPGRWRGHSFRPARSGCKSLIAKESFEMPRRVLGNACNNPGEPGRPLCRVGRCLANQAIAADGASRHYRTAFRGADRKSVV